MNWRVRAGQEECFMDQDGPCPAWAEYLARREEDLSPADRVALAAHVQQCSVCAAIQAEYQLFDAQLYALPSPLIKPLPRLRLMPSRPKLVI